MNRLKPLIGLGLGVEKSGGDILKRREGWEIYCLYVYKIFCKTQWQFLLSAVLKDLVTIYQKKLF